MEKVNGDIIVCQQPKSEIAEAYRTVAINLQHDIFNKNIKILEITQITAKYSDAVVANLSVIMAQTGKKVLLMDCNFRDSKLHNILDLSKEGVFDCLNTGRDYHEFIQHVEQSDLDVLTCGSEVENPGKILMSDAMQIMINSIKVEYDLILLNVSSVLINSDAILLSGLSDGIVLVLTANIDKVDQVQKVKERLSQAGGQIVGCILNKMESSVI